jgi:hypothetical protein
MIEDILSVTPLISSLFQCNYMIDKNTAIYLYLLAIGEENRAREFLSKKSDVLQYSVWDRNVIRKLANIGPYEYSNESDNSSYIFTNYNNNKIIEIYYSPSLRGENAYVIDIGNQQLQIRGPQSLMNFYAKYAFTYKNNYGENSKEHILYKYPYDEMQFVNNNKDKMRESLKEIMSCDVREYELRKIDGTLSKESKRKDIIVLQENKVEKKSGCT